jgi:hypothetical protein
VPRHAARRHCGLSAAVFAGHQQPLAAFTRRCKSSTRALVSGVRSLCIVYLYEQGDESLENAMLPLHRLRSSLDISRFLFSSLSSLHVVFEDGELPCPQQLTENCVLSVLLLLAANSDSFSSLRRFHIVDERSLSFGGKVELPFWSLARLPELAHCRFKLSLHCQLSCSSLVSALSSMQSLTSLDSGDCRKTGP